METLREVATNEVHSWLFMKGLEDPASIEATEIVRGRDHLPEAADALREWFTERLIVDPGVPGPFADLAANMIWLVLDAVDWQRLVQVMREREN